MDMAVLDSYSDVDAVSHERLVDHVVLEDTEDEGGGEKGYGAAK